MKLIFKFLFFIIFASKICHSEILWNDFAFVFNYEFPLKIETIPLPLKIEKNMLTIKNQNFKLETISFECIEENNILCNYKNFLEKYSKKIPDNNNLLENFFKNIKLESKDNCFFIVIDRISSNNKNINLICTKSYENSITLRIKVKEYFFCY